MTVIGTVGLRAFDLGVLNLLGPELIAVTVDGRTRQEYAVAVTGVDSGLAAYGGRVPVQWSNPEDVYQPRIVPCYRVTRNDMIPAFERQPWYEVVGRKPADDAQRVVLPDGTVGYTRYETQWRATPFDLNYEVTVIGRRREDAGKMLLWALRRMKPPWWPVAVVDSLGDTRQYDAGDLGVSDVSEIADIADRVIGNVLAFTVRAEVDLDDTSTSNAFLGASALDPHDPLYSRHDLILRTHAGVDPDEW